MNQSMLDSRAVDKCEVAYGQRDWRLGTEEWGRRTEDRGLGHPKRALKCSPTFNGNTRYLRIMHACELEMRSAIYQR